jgi:hypothetical protein
MADVEKQIAALQQEVADRDQQIADLQSQVKESDFFSLVPAQKCFVESSAKHFGSLGDVASPASSVVSGSGLELMVVRSSVAVQFPDVLIGDNDYAESRVVLSGPSSTLSVASPVLDSSDPVMMILAEVSRIHVGLLSSDLRLLHPQFSDSSAAISRGQEIISTCIDSCSHLDGLLASHSSSSVTLWREPCLRLAAVLRELCEARLLILDLTAQIHHYVSVKDSAFRESHALDDDDSQSLLQNNGSEFYEHGTVYI